MSPEFNTLCVNIQILNMEPTSPRKNSKKGRGRSVWIRDIQVRIRIRGSVPLTYGSGSCFQMLKKGFFEVFLLLRLEGTCTSVFKDKKSKISQKQQKSRFFLLLLACCERIHIQIWIREAQKTYRSYGSTTLGGSISFTVLQWCKFIEQSVLRTIYFGWSSLSFFFSALPRFFFTIFYVW